MNVLTAEIIGTALLILLGNGVVASCCLKDTKSGPAGWMVIATAPDGPSPSISASSSPAPSAAHT